MRREFSLVLAGALILVIGFLYSFDNLLGPVRQRGWLKAPNFGNRPQHYPHQPTNSETERHPIDRLIELARQEFDRHRDERVHDVKGAAKAYRAKRGRHPPPHFDRWVEYALSKGSYINEEFFDQIYEDLNPFWGVPARDIRYMATTWDGSISIRDGKQSFRISKGGGYNLEWVPLWMGALKEIEAFLPDMDIALNNVDEPRIIASWEDISELLKVSTASKHTSPSTAVDPIHDDFASYPAIPEAPIADKYVWNDFTTYWEKARRACHPNSAARNTEMIANMSVPPNFDVIVTENYIHNFTLARSACELPHIHQYHSQFINPGSSATSKQLFPMFSACKLTGISNDILLPAAKYFTDDPLFSGGGIDARHFPWSKKQTKAVWRGSPSGGISNAETWRYFQRQRLVAMMNGSQVTASARLHYPLMYELPVEQKELYGSQTPLNFPLPYQLNYPLAALKTTPRTLGAWTSTIANAGFTTLRCDYSETCLFMHPYFHEVDTIKLPDMFQYKFLPDADGFSYSGRYRSFLESTSLPLKATIFSEWHDSRLIPWYHFVPMDNTFRDWYGIMEYFVGYDPAAVFEAAGITDQEPDEDLRRVDHDEAAEQISAQGMEWSEHALRQEDMIVYMYRLLLEYARLCDDRRDRMGYTADL